MSARIVPLAATLLTACVAAPPAQTAVHHPVDRPDMVAACASADDRDWAAPGPPVHIFGNVFHVGTCTITVLLVTTPRGHILLDGATQKAAPDILANIRSLGFDPHDVKWIVSSHDHRDHADGLAAMKAATGAKLAANVAAVAALESGRPDAEDPQASWLEPSHPVKVDRPMRDGETLALGGTVMTMHATPAHAPDSASWTWTACDGRDCQRIAYLDSVSTPAPDTYRFGEHPVRVAQIKAGLAVMSGLPCDILLTPHPGQSAMYERYAGAKPLIDPGACAAYARAASAAIDARLAKERDGG